MKIMRRLLLVASIFYASQAFAFIPPPGPVSPVFDAINDVIQTGKALMKKFRTVADQVKYYKDEALNVVKSAQNFVNMDLSESPIQKEEDAPVLAATKEIVESKLGDVTNSGDVSEMFQKLFLTYPMDVIESFPEKQKEFILKKYRDKGVEFSNDSMMELYLTIRDLESGRLPAMANDLKDLSDCYVSGKSGSSSLCGSASDADEELGNWVNRYKLAKLEDSYTRMYEELVALNIQYETGTALQEGVSPSNTEEALDAGATGDKVAAANSTAESMKNLGINFEKPAQFEEKTPFAGAEDNLTALPLLDGIYELLSEAQYLHNTKQQLPNLRRPFLEYEKMNALHQVAVSKVVDSAIKSRDYFGNYYTDADDLWFGQGCSLRKEYLGRKCPNITGCKDVKEYEKYYVNVILCPSRLYQLTEYDKMSGLSKTAYDLYTASKVEQVLSLNDDEEDTSQNQIDGVAVIDMDMDTTTPDVDEELDLEGMVGGGNLTKDADNEYAEGAVREQDLNRWQIGSITSTMVGADMNSGHSKYSLKSKYPLWQDEKRFYDQYLREKYKNMELHFNNPIIAKPIFDLADQMNADMDIPQEARGQCRAVAQAEKQRKFDHVCWKDEEYHTYETECDDDGQNCRTVVVTHCCRKVVDYDCRRQAEIDAEKQEADCNKALNDALAREKQANTQSISAARSDYDGNGLIKQFLASSRLEQLKKDQDRQIDALEEKYKNDLIDVLQKRNKLINELSAVMDQLNEEKTEYNDLMGQKKDAESDAVAQEQVVSLGEKKSKENPDTPYITNIPNEAEETKAVREDEAKQAESSAKSHTGNIKRLEKQAQEYRDMLEKLDDSVEDIKENYINAAVALESALAAQMKNELENRMKEISALPLPKITGSSQTIGTIAGIAGEMFDTFKKHALEEVRAAYNKINGLGDDKYEADRYERTIFTIHQTMIKNIKAAKFKSVAPHVGVVGVVSGAFVVSNAGSIAIAASRFAGVALDSECDSTKEDEQYFVSLKGKSCDLTAPKRLFADRTPPVREIFHFDSADYESVLKTEGRKKGLFQGLRNPKTTRREFLKLGREMPKIWQIILGPNGFVERDVDLEDVLNQTISVQERYAPIMRRFVMQILNIRTSDKNNVGSEEFFATKGEIPVVGNVGELSVFFKYDMGMTFRETVFAFDEYFDYISTTKKKIDEKEVKEKKKSMLIRNQVGDYLQFVDLEQNYKTQVAQLKVKVKEGRKTIEEALERTYCNPKTKDTGYVKDGEMASKFVSSEFIADTEVYESVAACLDQGKNMYIAEAQKLIEQLPPMTDYLAERRSKLNAMLKSLLMDNDELVQLSDNTDPEDGLREKIESAKTDSRVVDRYADEAEEEFENNKNNFEEPYKAWYF